MITISTEAKWARVDEIIERVEKRKAKGEEPYEFGIEEYIDRQFNRPTKSEG